MVSLGELISLMNIGQEMARKLRAVKITTAEELERVGSREAFFKLKVLFPEVCLVHLYTLEGAISGVEFNQLPEDVKASLKAFSDQLK